MARMNKVTVYRFEVWEQDKSGGDMVWAPRMATLETVERVNGRADRASATEVERSDLDGSGYYPARPKIPRGA